MVIPEEPFWRQLEQWGFPLRDRRRDLIQRNSSQPHDWIEGFRRCVIPTHAPLDELLHEPWHFRYGPEEPLDGYPTVWLASLRVADDTDHNLEVALTHLSRSLGPPVDASAGNTRAWSWQFGHAGLLAMVFPPELNPGPNSRYATDPGARTECLLQVFPAWRPNLSPVEADELRSATCLWRDELGPLNGDLGACWFSFGEPRQVPADLRLPAGVRELLWEAGRQRFWWRLLPDVAWSVQAGQVVGVEHSELWPARGPGGASLSLLFPPLRPGGPPRESGALLWVDSAGARELLEASRQIAGWLQVPLGQEADYDT